MNPKTLPAATDHRMRAAGTLAAAAIGAVALAPSVSHAAVIDKVVNLTTSLSPDSTAADGNIFIDFSSMTASTSLSLLPTFQYRIYSAGSTGDVSIVSNGSDGEVANNNPQCSSPARLAAGATIDSTGTILTGDQYLHFDPIPPLADWNLGDRGYVGMSFALTDGTHFGWADVQVNPDSTATLHHFGYESTPDTAITTPGFVAVPEANPLELLALGAAALGAFRLVTTRRQAAETPAA